MGEHGVRVATFDQELFVLLELEAVEEDDDRVAVNENSQQTGFSLDEVCVLLTSIDEGAPAHEQLQALTARKLPEVEALVKRAQRMRDWLSTASACGCESLDGCALFIPPDDPLAVVQVTSDPQHPRG